MTEYAEPKNIHVVPMHDNKFIGECLSSVERVEEENAPYVKSVGEDIISKIPLVMLSRKRKGNNIIDGGIEKVNSKAKLSAEQLSWMRFLLFTWKTIIDFFNAGDLTELRQFFDLVATDECKIVLSSGEEINGKATLFQYFSDMMSAFPDMVIMQNQPSM